MKEKPECYLCEHKMLYLEPGMRYTECRLGYSLTEGKCVKTKDLKISDMEKTIEITEDYVSFETAKLLKEKGFKQECDYATSWYANQYYKNSCIGEWFEGEHQIIEDIDDKCNISYLSESGIFIPAPTLSVAMKWLREVHNCHIYVQALITTDGLQGYCPFCTKIGGVFMWENPLGEDYATSPTYEEALETAIKYCLENLI